MSWKNKVLTIFALIIILCPFYCIATLADGDCADVIVSLQIDNPIMKVNGVETEIDGGMGTKPVIIDARALVPIRTIMEAFGGTVFWDNKTKTVLIRLDDDTVKLVINSSKAYFNGIEESMDVEPKIINGRTMLPIRFVAEGFDLGVAWDGETQTIFVIRDSFTQQEYDNLMSEMQEYSGEPYLQINGNKPFFRDYEIITGSFEYYSRLDELGRCDVCFSSVAQDLMPVETRGSISSVTPSGWINGYYDTVDGKYLYNRCHLIGFQLTGENANERNLITGTRYMNVTGMLPFENDVAGYIKSTGNRVLYRATPVFIENDLVASGVLLEAYSVEDDGVGISFCVYCYNVQPGIVIDYKTGENRAESEAMPGKTAVSGVYRTLSGKKYHFDADCGGKNSYETTLEAAVAAGLTPCNKCVK